MRSVAVLRALLLCWPRPLEQLPAYTIGSCAMLWLFERVAAIL
jgi:hypothetical protein